MKRKKWLFSVLLSVITVCLLVYPAMAKEFLWKGKPLNLFGYITQGVSYNLNSGNYYNENDFNSALMNIFVEGDYQPTYNLTLYASTMLTMDWMYDIKSGDDSWDDKLFNKSRSNYYKDDEYWQILKEAHVTWTPASVEKGSFFLRVGKQIVSWGEMDGQRIMDQINPVDDSRGPVDVEFETSVIPIWLLRSEYSPPKLPFWIQDLALEFVFNPNADFIPNKTTWPGNSESGAWAPEMYMPMGGPFPFDYAYIGSMITDFDEPDEWDSDSFEYGLRLKALMSDWLITLNYFYGRENAPVMEMVPPFMTMEPAYDGRMIGHFVVQGEYPRQRFAGLTLNKDLSFLHIKSLGGFTPVMRVETLYEFDTTFATNLNTLEKFDRIEAGLAFDWKVKFKFLPQDAGFVVSPQVLMARIRDYPSAGLQGKEKDSLAFTLYLWTSYFNAKLAPSLFWWHDTDFDGDFLQLKATYDYTHKWRFTGGVNFFNGGEDDGNGFDCFEHKDNIFFKISYKLG